MSERADSISGKLGSDVACMTNEGELERRVGPQQMHSDRVVRRGGLRPAI